MSDELALGCPRNPARGAQLTIADSCGAAKRFDPFPAIGCGWVVRCMEQGGRAKSSEHFSQFNGAVLISLSAFDALRLPLVALGNSRPRGMDALLTTIRWPGANLRSNPATRHPAGQGPGSLHRGP